AGPLRHSFPLAHLAWRSVDWIRNRTVGHVPLAGVPDGRPRAIHRPARPIVWHRLGFLSLSLALQLVPLSPRADCGHCVFAERGVPLPRGRRRMGYAAWA